MEGDLSHLCDNLVKSDRFIVKIPAVDQVRIISGLDRTVEVLLLKSAFAKTFLALLSAACRALSCCSCMISAAAAR